MRTKRTKLSDEKLLSLIGTDARLSAEKLGKKLQVSPTTVRRRLKAAVRKGLIHTTVVVDPDKAGLGVQTVIGFRVLREYLEAILQALESHSEIKWLASVTGEYDILARVAFNSIDQLSAFLQDEIANIKGINNIESFICLDVPKGRFISLD